MNMHLSYLIKMSIGIVLAVSTPVEARQSVEIEVAAGSHKRVQTPVSFDAGGKLASGAYQMVSESGDRIKLQVSEEGTGFFILSDLPKGESIKFTVEKKGNIADPGITVLKDSSTVTFQSDGNRILTYYHGLNSPPPELDERYRRGGYIHPLFSPNGLQLTNHLDQTSHPHHSGIWSAWPKTEFEGRTPDFWNVHLNTGRVDQVGDLELMSDGPVFSGFTSTHQFKDLSAPEPLTALIEEWRVHIYGNSNHNEYFIFDLKVLQKAHSGSQLNLPQYRYGGVAFRGNQEWNDPSKVKFLTSDGQGREGDGSRIRWLAIYGEIEGSTAGLAIMDHPSNFRHPQPIRIHPETPYVNFSPVRIGSMSIQENEPYQATYRYITFDGEPDSKEVERLWIDFAYPPEVEVFIR